MKLGKIDHVIDVCTQHIENCKNQFDEVDSFDPELESYLTQYLLTIICSEFEQYIEELFFDRALKSGDTYLASFVRNNMHRQFRNPKTSKISEILQQFGDDYKNAFTTAFNSTLALEIAQSRYNNIIIERMKIAHSSGSNMTFTELLKSYEEGHIILDILHDVLFEI